jgi:hypothetical protein
MNELYVSMIVELDLAQSLWNESRNLMKHERFSEAMRVHDQAMEASRRAKELFARYEATFREQRDSMGF